MQKQEDKSLKRDLLASSENEENNIFTPARQKQNKLQSQQAQKNRSRGRSPNKKYGY
ncbi:hypothetical protein [Neobacillus vireti]|uniref:hypothetical protein n=1 Tax=Neobacillus vireti TaxID=220686 RepID=UPI0004056026|nr:hypothetical protein [Neobacillus vireti]